MHAAGAITVPAQVQAVFQEQQDKGKQLDICVLSWSLAGDRSACSKLHHHSEEEQGTAGARGAQPGPCGAAACVKPAGQGGY